MNGVNPRITPLLLTLTHSLSLSLSLLLSLISSLAHHTRTLSVCLSVSLSLSHHLGSHSSRLPALSLFLPLSLRTPLISLPLTLELLAVVHVVEVAGEVVLVE